MRVIHFPEHQSVGELYLGESRFGSARGTITIPHEEDLELHLGERAPSPDLSFLKQLAPDDLQAISVDIHYFGDEELQLMKHLTGLKALNLKLSRVTNDCFETLAQMSGLRVVDFAYTRITCEGISKLRALPLISLDLSHTLPNDDGLCELGNLTNLRQLIYMDNGLSGKGMKALAQLVSLENLFLAKTNIEDEYLSSIHWFKNLVLIDLSKTPITDEGARFLTAVRTLRGVLLDNTNTGDRTLENLSTLPYIVALFMRETNITDDGIAHLLKFDNLKTLALSRTKIGDRAIDYFAEMEPLAQIELDNTRISTEGLYRLIAKRPDVDVIAQAVTGEPLEDMTPPPPPMAGGPPSEGGGVGGLKAQIFELIVRAALAGEPWRESYASAMQINNIDISDVEAEIRRRQKTT